eukprot:TRINITY_DN6893_c0_g2_i2.p1 TRINITY_DN6893_c0_g2~~TRINITY_DN6893_c0_g2_i2.p1  ORF type:complete len:836 (-),score=138.03 TRINITY_DN6893_c0_g2_i2:24-2531(-)
MEENLDCVQRLCERGYSRELFYDDVLLELSVAAPDPGLAEFARSLAECFQQYANVIPSIEVDGEQTNTDRLFSPRLTVNEMRSHRKLVVAAAYAFANSLEKDDADRVRKNVASLLHREKELEEQEEKRRKPQAENFLVKICSTFFSTLLCCDYNIPGCYAPNGDHCQKLVEIGARANAGVFSIYRSTGKASTDDSNDLVHEYEQEEYENAELAYTEEGMFVFSKYAPPNGPDTTSVWCQAFKELIENGVVPAIICPKGFPTARCFLRMAAHVDSSASTSFMLHYQDPFFDDQPIKSYYDKKIDTVKPEDIVLSSSNVNELPTEGVRRRTTTLKQNGVATTMQVQRDLTSSLLGECMQQLKTLQGSSSSLPVAAGAFSQSLIRFLSSFVTDGHIQPKYLADGYDMILVNEKKKTKKKKKKKKSADLRVSRSVVTDKNGVVKLLLEASLMVMADSLDKSVFCAYYEESRHLFHEATAHVSKRLALLSTEDSRAQLEHLRESYSLCEDVVDFVDILWSADHYRTLQGSARECLKSGLRTIYFHELDEAVARKLMQWCFVNEDQVWRTRGGRPHEETLDQYMSFLSPEQPPNLVLRDWDETSQVEEISDGDDAGDSAAPNAPAALPHHGRAPFAGVVVFTDRAVLEGRNAARRFDGNAMVAAYAIGDYTSFHSYEVATAWTSEKYRGLGLAITLYRAVVTHLSTLDPIPHRMTCDVLAGTLMRIASHSTALLWAMERGVGSWLISCHPSYSSDTASGHEHFERVVVSVPNFLWVERCFDSPAGRALISVYSSVAPAIVYVRRMFTPTRSFATLMVFTAVSGTIVFFRWSVIRPRLLAPN